MTSFYAATEELGYSPIRASALPWCRVVAGRPFGPGSKLGVVSRDSMGRRAATRKSLPAFTLDALSPHFARRSPRSSTARLRIPVWPRVSVCLPSCSLCVFLPTRLPVCLFACLSVVAKSARDGSDSREQRHDANRRGHSRRGRRSWAGVRLDGRLLQGVGRRARAVR